MTANVDDPFGGALDGKPRVVATYKYVDENGDKLYKVDRWEPGRNGRPKSFTQSRWNGKRFVKGVEGVRRVPFKLPELIDAVGGGERIYVCEGESSVLAMIKAGYGATCNSGGATKWPTEFAGYFDDADVVIVADRDDNGTLHADVVRSNLDGIASSVRVVRSKVDEPKADVVDHLDAGHSLDELVEVTPAQLAADVAEIQERNPTKTRQESPQEGSNEPEVPEVLLTVLGLVVANGGTVNLPKEPGDDYDITCPMHDDSNPSATLNVGDERPVVFHCFGGCDQDDLFRYLVEEQGIDATSLMELRDTEGPISDGSSWRFIDPWPYLNGDAPKNLPTIGLRTDDVGLIYPGLVHMFAGESGSAKSWIAQHIAAQEVMKGEHVVYLDYESGPAEVFERLMLLTGGDREAVADRFHYVRPDESFRGDAVELFRNQVKPVGPSLVVLDGVSDAMGIDGLSINDNDDAVRFGATVKRLRAESGAAVALIDHVPKSTEGPRENPIGAQHKKSFIDGALYMVESTNEMIRGVGGVSTIRTTSKDRPGEVKPHAINKVIARFVMTATDGGGLSAHLEPPSGAPVVKYSKKDSMESDILDLLRSEPFKLQKDEIVTEVGGNAADARRVRDDLLESGVIETKAVKLPDSRGHLCPRTVWGLAK